MENRELVNLVRQYGARVLNRVWDDDTERHIIRPSLIRIAHYEDCIGNDNTLAISSDLGLGCMDQGDVRNIDYHKDGTLFTKNIVPVISQHPTRVTVYPSQEGEFPLDVRGMHFLIVDQALAERRNIDFVSRLFERARHERGISDHGGDNRVRFLVSFGDTFRPGKLSIWDEEIGLRNEAMKYYFGDCFYWGW